ncbi:HAMP domain-containing sensor histidine kinase [Marinicella sp. S1101]|uniref:sensor histidine kinase n=1 Tax=Marinicella marina TaxID=2996016 RepID=UPI0022608539|nr:HAMP domain-containing sensor histidine kinase [Marinicella marina]MCX7553036.1 HAMP domain-containing sensor histidine kinase [Marinicella marina]MDJ1139604.1 HAMP domain-containing sensor histidine kinase [Marinicella marina]
MNSIAKKLSFVLLTLFIVIGIILAFITRYASVQYNHEMTQRLNGSIAMYVAAEEQLIQNGQHNEAAIKKLAERAMVINPTVEVYLLDNEGRILSHNLPTGTALPDQIPLSQIKTFISEPEQRPILNLDPRSPQTEKAFSAAKVTFNGQDEGYVYAILGGQTYELLAKDISKNWVLKVALASIAAVLILTYLIGILMVNQLTKPLTHVTKKVRRFQQQMTGETPNNQKVGDEIKVLETAFQNMQRKIKQQVKQIQAADQNRRDLITNVSHDLRTPLASIQGYMDTLLIKKDQLDEKQRDYYLATASKHCIRLNQLVNDLFELSKLDSLVIQPKLESFSLSELMQDVSMEFKMLAQQRNVDLKIDLLDGNTEVRADIGLMQRVFENLINNAIKHTPKNGQVMLKLQQHNDRFKVIIQDTGRGISEKELPHIFDRLFQAENSSNHNQNSSGLGLAIVKKIMDLHHTKIKVISQLNRGTQFSFQLPVAA